MSPCKNGGPAPGLFQPRLGKACRKAELVSSLARFPAASFSCKRASGYGFCCRVPPTHRNGRSLMQALTYLTCGGRERGCGARQGAFSEARIGLVTSFSHQKDNNLFWLPHYPAHLYYLSWRFVCQHASSDCATSFWRCFTCE